MKRLMLFIICLLLACMIFSCCCIHEAEQPPMPTPEPAYCIEYTRGVYILREIDDG